jgi:molybdate transport system substrate-binding protein
VPGQPIRILSADAPKGGLRIAAERFSSESGIPHEIELATGPVIKARIAKGETGTDLVIIPAAWLSDLAAEGHVVAGTVAPIGKITVGVTIRTGAHEPDLSSVDSFVAAIRDADQVIYNTASSGTYVADMLARLGLEDDIRHKAVVLPTGVAVMEALAADETGRAIGFGHVTEIRRHADKGTRLVGPLPGEIGRETVYGVALNSGASQPDAARRLADYLVSPEGKAIFLDSGVL